MFTQCPDCKRWFRIEPEQVEVAHGLARCGDCDTVFNASAALREQAPESEPADSAAFAVVEAGSGEAVRGSGEDAGDIAAVAMAFAEPSKSRAAPWIWGAALALAALALVVQLVNANRYTIARAPVAGGALQTTYRGLGLPIEPRLNLARYTISDASLASPPGAAGRLALQALLINRARHEQRLPLIELRLRDRRGDVVASRLLLPSDYAPTRISNLAAGRGLRFRVEVADPGAGATGFTLVLCRHSAQAVLCRPS